jgi:glycerol-3-phosphate dehydrogenase
LVPELGAFDITGGVVFHDGLMWSAERIVLEVVQAAAEAGALVVNHATVEGPVRPSEPAGPWLLRDALTGTEVHVRPLAVVNATGASGPAVAKSLGYSSDSLGTFALALNLLVPSRGHRAAFALPGERRESKGVLSLSTRQLFVVPWKDRLMIGTGHYPLSPRADPAEAAATRSREFLELVNRSWPGDPFSEDEVALVHWGVLPSPDLDGGGAPRPLKGPRIVEGRPGDGAGPLFLSAMTAKFTEGRLAAERVVDRVLQGLGKSPVECKTRSTPLPGAPAGSVGDLEAQAVAADSNGLPARTVRHLVRSYGSRYGEVLAYRDRLRDWSAPVADGEVTILAQWAYAVDREMACTAEDLVRRRTDLGSRGLTSPDVLERARHFLAGGSAGKD